MIKNKHAQAMARLRLGIKEKPSATKRAAALANLAAARAKRWPAVKTTDDYVAEALALLAALTPEQRRMASKELNRGFNDELRESNTMPPK